MPARPLDWIFDTTVLSAFALVGRMDILEARYGGRSCCPIEVQAEVISGISRHPSLGAIVGAAWLGTPVRLETVDQIEQIRQQLGGGILDDRHRGEAATIAVAAERDGIVVTDDTDATRLARAEGLRTINTTTILRAHVREGQLSPDDAVALLEEMIDVYGRRLPRLPSTSFYAS